MFIQVDIDKEDLIQNFRENVFDEDIKDFILDLDKELENGDFSISLIIGLLESLDYKKEIIKVVLKTLDLEDYIEGL